MAWLLRAFLFVLPFLRKELLPYLMTYLESPSGHDAAPALVAHAVKKHGYQRVKNGVNGLVTRVSIHKPK